MAKVFAFDNVEQVSLLVAGGLFAYVIGSFAYRHFLRPAKKLSRYGNTAIVTGATDGIGKAIAFELARQHKLNLVLVSRTAAKLNEVADEIKAKYSSVQVDTLAIDFGALDDSALQRLKSVVDSKEVGILVNNVGMSYDYPEWFHSVERSKVQQLIDLNVRSTTLLTHLVLPAMTQRKRGLVVNISSAAAVFPAPLLAEYGAAKAYVDKFTHALSLEYKQHGVDFQVQNPLYVATKMAKMRPSLQAPTATQFARSSIAAWGYDTQISPYWVHAIMLAAGKRMPAFLFNQYVFGMHKSIRARALKKVGAAKKQ